MSEPLLTKRLHISGLTPHIKPRDLEGRLSSFGKVKSMDGFGALDALGDPRKFAFVTMEIGPKDLAKCLNVLSGSTWKGARLRIGEAKPDFRERLSQFNSKPGRPERPRRTHNPNHGRPSSTLPLTPLSATVAATTPGWVATPSGRVIRPMRMRPERPLGPIRAEHGASSIKGTNSKVKKRVKPPPVRARRRLIDPTKWDSVYLKGVFLDAVPFSLPASKDTLKISACVDKVDEEEIDNDTVCGVSQHVASSPPVLPPSIPQLSQDTPLSASLRIHRPTEVIDLRSETNGALAMLNEMFGDKEDWDGRESFDDMEDNVEREMEMDWDDEDGTEIAPSNSGQGERDAAIKDKGTFEANVFANHEDGMTERVASDNDVEMEEIGPSALRVAEPTPTNLKALFAPKEDASFSLLNHLNLDLDLELDNDILGINAPPDIRQEDDHPSQSTLSKELQIHATTPISKRAALDPSHPLLFPLLDSLPHPHAHISNLITAAHRNISTCFSFPSEIRVRNLRNLPPSATFTRSSQDTSELIRERWEKDKSALTHEWKKAWREARGSRKGGRAAGGDGGS